MSAAIEINFIADIGEVVIGLCGAEIISKNANLYVLFLRSSARDDATCQNKQQCNTFHYSCSPQIRMDAKSRAAGPGGMGTPAAVSGMLNLDLYVAGNIWFGCPKNKQRSSDIVLEHFWCEQWTLRSESWSGR